MRVTCFAAWMTVTCVVASPAWAQSSRPDPMETPGAINPAVTQENIQTTICVRGWTGTVRPLREFTSALKRQQIRAAGFGDRRMGSYEEDHLVPLDLGGAPSDQRNLWPQPRDAVDGWTADRKDDLEYRLNQLLCGGAISLATAQQAIATDWIGAYRRYVGEAGGGQDGAALHQLPELTDSAVEAWRVFVISPVLFLAAAWRLLIL